MRLHQEKISIQATDPIREIGYGIRDKDMGLILEVLRSRMYKDPIKAICREISCNSRDAHREVGTPDRPIEIHLPTVIRKQIEFKDWGPGISPRRINEIFVNYGASTKRGDNNQLGMWGLGSKTPYSYSDTFSIITIYNGKKYHYNAIIDESRAGKLLLQHEEPTTDPAGTTIIVPVNESDFRRFAEACIEATRYWKVKPTFTSLPSGVVYPEEKKPLLKGDGWELFTYHSKNSYDTAEKAVAIIDGIGYKVSPDDLSASVSDDETRWLVSVLNKELHVHFPIGKLSLASNRDSIHFDERTRNELIRRLKNVVDGVYKHAKEKLDSEINNLIDAEIFWASIIEEFPKLAQYDKPVWHGFELKGKQRRPEEDDEIEISSFSHVVKSNGSNGIRVVRNKQVIEFFNKCEFYYVDCDFTERQLRSRALQRMLDTSFETKIVYVIDFKDTATRKRWLNEEGFKHINLLPTSSLPKPERRKRSDAGTGRGRGPNRGDFDAWIYDTKYIGSKSYEYSWKPVTVEKNSDDEGVYIVCKDKRAQEYETGKLSGSRYDINAIKEIFDFDLYLIREKDVKYLGEDWVSFESYCLPLLKSYLLKVDKYELDNIEKWKHAVFTSSYSNLRNKLSSAAKKLNPDHCLNKWIEESRIFESKAEEIKKAKLAYSRFGFVLDSQKKSMVNSGIDPILLIYKNEFEKQYPMLKFVYEYSSISEKDILDYISTMDMLQNQTKQVSKQLVDNDPINFCAEA